MNYWCSTVTPECEQAVTAAADDSTAYSTAIAVLQARAAAFLQANSSFQAFLAQMTQIGVEENETLGL